MSKREIFEQMASLVRMRELQLRFKADLNAHEPLWRLDECIGDQGAELFSIFPVYKNSEFVGWIHGETFVDYLNEPKQTGCEDDEDGNDPCVGDVCNALDPSSIVSADATLLDVLPKLCSKRLLFVVTGCDITGTVDLSCLSSLPAKLCFFALTAELEDVSLKSCLRRYKACWEALTPGRQAKAMDLYELKARENPQRWRPDLLDIVDGELGSQPYVPGPRDFIKCTTMADKSRMLSRTVPIDGWSRPRFVEVFKKTERLRNACAHYAGSDDVDEIIPPAELTELVADVKKLIAAIRREIIDDIRSSLS